MRKSKQRTERTYFAPIFALNIILFAVIALIISLYSKNYEEKLNTENLSNIKNLNQSTAIIASSYFDTKYTSLENIVKYIEKKGLDLEEALGYIEDAVSEDEAANFQLISPSYDGVGAGRNENGNFTAVNYSHSSYGNITKIISAAGDDRTVKLTPEFTDSHTAIKSFAFYSYITIKESTGNNENYTLLWLSETDDVVDLLNIDGGYLYMATVLIDSNGDYILSNNSFKATNFYDYLYTYNGLTLDESTAIKTLVKESHEGVLYYSDSRDRECIFSYTPVAGSEWYCVTAIPLSSFHALSIDYEMIILIVLTMLLILITDVLWLAIINRRLRVSMSMEKQANAAKSEFLSRMSHDIRTPLNGIIGSVTLAQSENNSPETAEYLNTIRASGKFLLGLVNDILDMSRVESGKVDLHPEPYFIQELRGYLVAVMMPLAREKKVELKIKLDECPRAIMLDKLRFNQICFNLLSNAVKFTPEGGHVIFEFLKDDIDETKANIEIVVSDDGIGMSEEFQKHMFESFAQENREINTAQGTGLGLAIVKNLVGLMNGQMSVESKLNEGTTFRLSFVFAICGDDVVEKETDSIGEKSELVGKRVLLCEDNEINSIIAVKLLNKAGVTVEEAKNGRVGADKFAASAKGYYDAVLMDVMMPEMDGLSATREIRASSHPDAKRIPIIAMTANAYITDIENCIVAGMNTHIAKPFEPEILLSTLAAYITEYEINKGR